MDKKINILSSLFFDISYYVIYKMSNELKSFRLLQLSIRSLKFCF